MLCIVIGLSLLCMVKPEFISGNAAKYDTDVHDAAKDDEGVRDDVLDQVG